MQSESFDVYVNISELKYTFLNEIRFVVIQYCEVLLVSICLYNLKCRCCTAVVFTGCVK